MPESEKRTKCSTSTRRADIVEAMKTVTTTSETMPSAAETGEYESPAISDYGTLLELTAGNKFGSSPDSISCIPIDQFS
jgi:hypothetical protein